MNNYFDSSSKDKINEFEIISLKKINNLNSNNKNEKNKFNSSFLKLLDYLVENIINFKRQVILKF